MRVELFGNKSLVSSVEVSLSAAGLHVLVNLTKRWGPAHCQGSSLQFRARPEEEFLPHDTLVFSDPDAAADEAEEASKVEVVIVAESEDEARLLQPVLRYQAQDKDQFTVLYVPYKAFLPGTTLVSYRSAG
jgi:hypothetical protein